jgi:SAM-dependent methyltransferase
MDTREARRRHGAQRHPWERARLRHVQALLAGHGVAAGARVVDVGAGDAYVATALAAAGHDVVAVDSAWTDAERRAIAADGVCAQHDLDGVSGVDVALLLDVIEHVDDDISLLRQAMAALRPEGLVIITVPAWPRLMSTHDDVLGHRRRYTPHTLLQACETAQLQVTEWGGCFHGLSAVRASALLARAWRGRPRDRSRQAGAFDVAGFNAPAVVGDVVTAVLSAELMASRALARRGHRLPGLSLYAVGRAPRSC